MPQATAPFPPSPEPTATPALPSRTPILVVPTKLGLMKVYKSAQHNFSIQYPRRWTEGPPQPGIDAVASLVDGQGGSLSIAEEDTEGLGMGELTLEQYADRVLLMLSAASFNFEIDSRQLTTIPQGMPAELLKYNILGGGVKGTSFVYLDERGIGFHAAYSAPIAQYQEMEEVIAYSVTTFRDHSLPAPPPPTLTPTATATPSAVIQEQQGLVVSMSVDLVTAQVDTPTTFSYSITIKNDGTGPAVVVRVQNLSPTPSFQLRTRFYGW